MAAAAAAAASSREAGGDDESELHVQTRTRSSAVTAKPTVTEHAGGGALTTGGGEAAECFIRDWLNDGAADALVANLQQSRWLLSKFPNAVPARVAAATAVTDAAARK